MELVRTPFGPDPIQRPSLDKGASERLSRSSRLQTELSSNDWADAVGVEAPST